LAAVAPTAIETLYGESYLSGSLSLSILAATSILPAYSTLEMDVMKGIGYTKHFLSIGVAALLVDVVAVTILAGPLGTTGGALARVFLWGTSVIIGYWVLRKKVKIPFGEGLFRSLMLAIVMGLSLVLAEQFLLIPYSQPLQVRILTDLVVFVLVGIVAGRGLRVFKRHDFELMKQALPSRLTGLVDRASQLLIWDR
jgi:O-antigen/teichoic acid export membrane protein